MRATRELAADLVADVAELAGSARFDWVLASFRPEKRLLCIAATNSQRQAITPIAAMNVWLLIRRRLVAPIGRSESLIHSLQEPTYSLPGSRPAISIPSNRWHAVTPEPHIATTSPDTRPARSCSKRCCNSAGIRNVPSFAEELAKWQVDCARHMAGYRVDGLGQPVEPSSGFEHQGAPRHGWLRSLIKSSVSIIVSAANASATIGALETTLRHFVSSSRPAVWHQAWIPPSNTATSA